MGSSLPHWGSVDWCTLRSVCIPFQPCSDQRSRLHVFRSLFFYETWFTSEDAACEQQTWHVWITFYLSIIVTNMKIRSNLMKKTRSFKRGLHISSQKLYQYNMPGVFCASLRTSDGKRVNSATHETGKTSLDRIWWCLNERGRGGYWTNSSSSWTIHHIPQRTGWRDRSCLQQTQLCCNEKLCFQGIIYTFYCFTISEEQKSQF